MATLTSAISATLTLIDVTDPGTPTLGDRFEVDDELLEFRGLHGDVTTRWKVNRGIEGTTKATHAQGATLAPFVVTTSGLDEAAHDLLDHTGLTGVGGGLPTGWTQTDATHVDAGDGSITGLEYIYGSEAAGHLYLHGGDLNEYEAALHLDRGVDGVGGGVAVVQGGYGLAGFPGSVARLSGGPGNDEAVLAAEVYANGGTATDPGRLGLKSDGSYGLAGQAMVSAPGDQVDRAAVWGGIIVAAGVPSGAPEGNLPVAYDTTASTGGLYIWNGSAWVKVATIL